MLKLFKTPEERWAARQERVKRWDRPLTGLKDRLAAWTNMVVVDHGFVRMVYLNRHRVTPRLWRSAQPAPGDIARMAKDGVRTIVNLRGGREHGAWPLQREACERLGIELAELTLRSRAAPEREMLLGLPAFFDSLTYPALAHCKSGADRAGLFAALYLLVVEKASAAQAAEQLSLRYGHVRLAPTGVLDAFIEAYAREGEANGLRFMDWVREVYDPARVQASFRTGTLSTLLVDKVLRRE